MKPSWKQLERNQSSLPDFLGEMRGSEETEAWNGRTPLSELPGGGSLLGRLRLAGLTKKHLGPKCPQLCPLRFPGEMLAAALTKDVPRQT